jgi:glycosyltransferase involved in cell wall biosynthesis
MRILDEIIGQYSHLKNRIKIVEHEQNQGLIRTRCTGAQAASGDYLLFIDSDDYLEKDAAQILAQKAQETDADLIIFDFWIQFRHKAYPNPHHIGANATEYIRSMIRRECSPTMYSKLIRTNLYKEIIPELQQLRIQFGEDVYASVLLASRTQKITQVKRCLYHYVQYNYGSICHNSGAHTLVEAAKFVETIGSYFHQQDIHTYDDDLQVYKLKVKLDILLVRKSVCLNDIQKAFPDAMPYLADSGIGCIGQIILKSAFWKPELLGRITLVATYYLVKIWRRIRKID